MNVRQVVDALIIPVGALSVFAISLLADYAGLTTAGMGRGQWALLIVAVGVAIGATALKLKPLAFLASRGVGGPEVVLAATSCALSLVVADVLARHFAGPAYVATRYGWDVPANATQQWRVEDAKGQWRDVRVQHSNHGFKRWGDTLGTPRVLVIGDSFTEMTGVSNGEEWYSYLERQFPGRQWFVFGAGGYGTLQELMVLEDVFSSVQPQVILWQFCVNDYSDNLFEYGRALYPTSNMEVRPYLEGDTIVYRLPLPFAPLRRRSFLADRILYEYDHTVQDRYTARRARDPEGERKTIVAWEAGIEKQFDSAATLVTKRILERVRRRAGAIPIYFFHACGPLGDRERTLCTTVGLHCIEGVTEAVNAVGATGAEVRRVNDGHWNLRGNKVAGEFLAGYLQTQPAFSTAR